MRSDPTRCFANNTPPPTSEGLLCRAQLRLFQTLELCHTCNPYKYCNARCALNLFIFSDGLESQSRKLTDNSSKPQAEHELMVPALRVAAFCKLLGFRTSLRIITLETIRKPEGFICISRMIPRPHVRREVAHNAVWKSLSSWLSSAACLSPTGIQGSEHQWRRAVSYFRLHRTFSQNEG